MEMIQSFRKRSRVNTDIGKIFSVMDEVRKLIEDLQTSVEEVKRKQSEILVTPVPNDTRTQELDGTNSKIKSLSGAIRTKLKGIERGISESEKSSLETVESSSEPVRQIQIDSPSKYVPAALRIRKTLYSSLLKQYIETMTEYQSTQLRYRDQVKNRLKRQFEITNRSYTEDELEVMIDKGNVSAFTKSIIIDTQEAKKNLHNIQSRHNDLLKLEKSIQELAELFQELAMRVELQGELLDNIEQNVANAQDYVERGTTDVKRANTFKKSWLKKKAYILTAASVILIVLILVISLSIYFKDL